MDVKRGAIVLASGPGEFTNKPRPFLIVQSDVFNTAHSSFSLCPVTSHVGGETLFRIAIEPTVDTGLIDPAKSRSTRSNPSVAIVSSVSSGTRPQPPWSRSTRRYGAGWPSETRPF